MPDKTLNHYIFLTRPEQENSEADATTSIISDGNFTSDDVNNISNVSNANNSNMTFSSVDASALPTPNTSNSAAPSTTTPNISLKIPLLPFSPLEVDTSNRAGASSDNLVVSEDNVVSSIKLKAKVRHCEKGSDEWRR